MAKFTAPPEAPQKEYKTLPAGNHVARCISFIDLGTQKWEWQGEPKEGRKIRISWETPNEKEIFNEENGEQPFMVSKEYTLSFHEKANLKIMLVGIFPEFDQHKFNPEKDLIGKDCMINVVNEVSKKGNTFAKITAVTPVPKGMECPDQVNKGTYFFMGYNEGGPQDLDEDIFLGLPQFIREKIVASPEYAKLSGNDPVLDGVMKDAESVFKKKET